MSPGCVAEGIGPKRRDRRRESEFAQSAVPTEKQNRAMNRHGKAFLWQIHLATEMKELDELPLFGEWTITHAAVD